MSDSTGIDGEQARAEITHDFDFIHRGDPAGSLPRRLGDFEIVREVGRGGMGAVYEARQVSLDRRVALKVLRFAAVSDPQLLERFRREAETVAQLHHTNIVPVFSIGQEAGVNYYAMQYIDGQSLADVLRESGEPPGAATVAEWGLQLAEALSYAHQHGVIHRDIKPSNVLVDGEGRVWLTDFGLARRLTDVTLSATGALLGTPRYMSPEQATATERRIDHRTDIYSLGATLYEMATGKPVFEGTSPQDVLAQIFEQEPRPPRELRPGLPRDLETIILKCLHKDPARRYTSARELAEDLRAFLEDRPIRARRPSAVERASRWTRKHRRSVTQAAAAAAVTLAVALAAWAVWQGYGRWQLGTIRLSTDQAPLAARLVSGGEQPLGEPFTVPMQA
ncbi:MAG: serine/threonine protein kinase, partial [Thermoguttaceae bacterium]|nr:serine/threonine protein kinase [Thermoguttaceae bacterium]